MNKELEESVAKWNSEVRGAGIEVTSLMRSAYRDGWADALASSSTASGSDLMKLTNEPLIANPRERESMTYEQFTELAHKAKTLTVLPDLIADNWPDKKYTLDEIVERLGAIK